MLIFKTELRLLFFITSQVISINQKKYNTNDTSVFKFGDHRSSIFIDEQYILMNVSADVISLVIIFKKIYPSNIYRFNYIIHKQKFKVELLIIVAIKFN